MKNKFLKLLKEKKLMLLRKFREKRDEAAKAWANTSGSEIVRSRPFLAGVALAISVIIWGFVAWDGNTEGTRTIDVPINYSNLTRGFTVYDSDKTVQVRVIGRIAMLSRTEVSEFKAEVDLQGLQTGKYKLPIKIEVPSYVRIRSWNPAVASVEIYRQIERTLPLTWRLDGKLAEGKIVASVELSPKEITLAGPESDVLAVQSLEVVIPVAKLADGAAMKLPVKASDASQLNDKMLVSPGSVNVKITLEDEIIGEQIPVNVPVIGELAEGIEIDSVKVIPDRVTIRGGGEAVRQMSSLSLSPIDVTGLDQNLQLMLPLLPSEAIEGVEIIGPDRARVEITVRKKMAAKTYGAVPVKVTGALPGVEWRVTPASAALTIEGSQLKIDSLPAGDAPFELYVDVSNIVARQISLPVLVRKVQRDFDVVQIEPEQVTLTVIE